jgi:hypothetical protein
MRTVAVLVMLAAVSGCGSSEPASSPATGGSAGSGGSSGGSGGSVSTGGSTSGGSGGLAGSSGSGGAAGASGAAGAAGSGGWTSSCANGRTKVTGPIQAKAGEKLSCLKIESSSGPGVVIDGVANVWIDDCEIGPTAGVGVHIKGSGATGIRVTNSYIHTEHSGSSGMNSGLGVFVSGGPDDVLIQGNRMERSESHVYTTGGTSNIRVIGNYMLNPLGPFPRGQGAQFDTTTGGEISDNFVECNPEKPTGGESDAEDIINLYKSSNVTVANNFLRGGDSGSGCGVLVGDAGGKGQIIKNNVIIRTSQCGIGVASGEDHVVDGNKILDTSFPGGSGNTGIYVWNQYSPTCANITVTNNIVRNKRPDGTHSPFWDGGNCGTITQSGNVFDTSDGGQAESLLLPEAQKLPPPTTAPTPPKPYVP